MNVSAQTQSRITSFVKVDKPLEDNAKTKEKKLNGLTKSKSFNEKFNTVKNSNNKKNLISTKSYDESLNNSSYGNINSNNDCNNVNGNKLKSHSISSEFEDNNEILPNFILPVEAKDNSSNNSISSNDKNNYLEDNNNQINKKTEVNNNIPIIPIAFEDIEDDEVYSNNFNVEDNIFDNISNDILDGIISRNENIQGDFYNVKNSIKDEIKKQDGEILTNDLNINENDMNNGNSSYKSKEPKKRKRTNKENNNKETTGKQPRKRKNCPYFKKIQRNSFLLLLLT